MTLRTVLLCSTLAATAHPLLAEEKRALGAHAHGHGALNIAVEGATLAMELEVPGFDIVGFEHAAESDADKMAVEKGVTQLLAAADLFILSEAAGCEVTSAEAELHGDDSHGEHGHDDHGEHKEHDNHADHDDDKHDHDDHEDHKDEHAHDDHDDHKDEHGHDDHAHEDHEGHDDHEGGESHSEFHAEYAFTCADPDKLTQIELAYFGVFPNAEELEVQVVSDAGAKKVEASGEAPIVPLN